MTPEQKIKREIIRSCRNGMDNADYMEIPEVLPDAESVDKWWEVLVEEDMHWDYMDEIRDGEIDTNIDPQWSRHHESKSVAMKCCDGTWVGWTYWYGGGKHGDPSAIDWMPDAYELECVEEEKLVTVRTWTKKA